VPAFAGPFQFGCGPGQIGQVDDRDAVQPVGVVGQPLGQVVVAAGDRGRAVGTEVVEHLPVAPGVDQAVVDAHPVHPGDALGRGRVVFGMQDDGSAPLLGHADQGGEHRPPVGPPVGGEGAQQVAGDAVGQALHAVGGEAVQPGPERVRARREGGGLPVRVDVDDGHSGPLSIGM